MTAEVTIHVGTLENVLHVPIQAVTSDGDERVVYLAGGERRVVEVGEFNDEYIEIKNGLAEGDKVLLHLPEGKEGDTEKPEKGEEPETEKTEETPPAPPESPVPANA